MDSTFLGISKTELQLIDRVRDLQLLYEFNDNQADAAYRLSKRYDLPIEKAFDYVEAYSIHERNTLSMLGMKVTFDSYDKLMLMEDDELLYAYFTLGLPIAESISIAREIEPDGYTLKDLNKDILEEAKVFTDLTYSKIIECSKAAGPDLELFYVLDAMQNQGLDVEEAVIKGEQDADEDDLMSTADVDWEMLEDTFDDIAFGDYGEDDNPDPYGPRYKDDDDDDPYDSDSDGDY